MAPIVVTFSYQSNSASPAALESCLLKSRVFSNSDDMEGGKSESPWRASRDVKNRGNMYLTLAANNQCGVGMNEQGTMTYQRTVFIPTLMKSHCLNQGWATWHDSVCRLAMEECTADQVRESNVQARKPADRLQQSGSRETDLDGYIL